MKCVKRVYDRTVFFKRYLRDDIDIRCHGDCLRIPLDYFFKRRRNHPPHIDDFNEFDVLTPVRETFKKIRPIESVVWLYTLKSSQRVLN